MFEADGIERLDVFKNFSPQVVQSQFSFCYFVIRLTLEGLAALERTLRCQTGKVARDLLTRQEFAAGKQAVTIFISRSSLSGQLKNGSIFGLFALR